MIGKDIRIERIMDRNTGRSVIVPMDHGFSMGQIEGLLDMTKVITDVSDGGANAIILHKGMVKRGHRRHGRDIGLFINRWGIPLLIMIYPRGKGIDPFSPQAIGHCVRVAEELGADLIKTNYPGNPE